MSSPAGDRQTAAAAIGLGLGLGHTKGQSPGYLTIYGDCGQSDLARELGLISSAASALSTGWKGKARPGGSPISG